MWGVTGFLRRQTQGALPFSMWGVTGFLRRQTQGASPIIYVVVECHRVPALSNPGALPFSMLPFSMYGVTGFLRRQTRGASLIITVVVGCQSVVKPRGYHQRFLPYTG